MKIPKSALNNIENIIPELNPVDRKLYYSVTCPSCGKKEAYVYKDKDLIVCNRLNKCGYVKSIFDYLKEDRQLTSKEIMKIIISNTDNKEEIIIKDNSITLPKNVKMFNDNSGFQHTRALNYLVKRNIPINNINELGYIFDEGPYEKRIYVPFIEDEEIVFFTTRDLTNKAFLRWKDPPGIDKHNFVYNIDKMWNTNTIFIFEGLFCALSLKDQIGTAMLTNRLGKEQAKKILSTLPTNIVLIPDIDRAGLTSIDRNIELLKTYKPHNLDVNFYIYYVDNKRKFNVESVMALKLEREKESEVIDKIRGFKDFNDTGLNSINLDNCEIYGKKFSNLRWANKA